MKKIVNAGVLLTAVLCICLLVSVSAFCQGNGDSAAVQSKVRAEHPERLVDDAELLNEEEKKLLEERLDEISERQNCDVAIVTVDSLGGQSASSYADDFYDNNGYGMGQGDDGILFLLAISERKWAISTYGFGTEAFTDAGQEYIMKQVRPALSDGNYYESFMSYAELADDFLDQAGKGEAYDKGHLPVTASNIIFCAAAGLIGGFFLALLRVFIMKSQMRTVYNQSAAAEYLQKDSIRFQERSDLLVRKTVNKVYIEPEKKSGGGSGGSSVHTSSSGRSHGGSSGSF